MLGRATILKKLLSRLSGIFASCPFDFRGRLLNQESCLSTCGKMKHTHILLRNAKDRRRINGDSFCFRSWPESLEPSPAARTQIFRENLSLPDSGWPRFVRMFDLSSAQGIGVATACSRSGPSWNRKRIFGPKTKGNLVSCPSESEGQETQVAIHPLGAGADGEAGATESVSKRDPSTMLLRRN